MQKARGQATTGATPSNALPLLVGIRFQVLFHSPHGSAFHLSLTVLVHYRSQATYLALGDGPPGFPQGFTCPAVLRNQTREPRSFRLRGFHPVSPRFPDAFGYEIGFQLPGAAAATPRPALQPRRYNASRLDIPTVWALPSSLAAPGGIAIAFCSSGY